MNHNNFDQIISRILNRREFVNLMSRGMGGSALAFSSLHLSGCGNGGSGDSNGNDDSEDDDTGNNDNTDTNNVDPSPEYTVLKRTSFGVSQSSMAQIESQGINEFLEQQLDYQAIDDGNLEATIATLFPLTQATAAELLAGFPDNIGDVAVQMASATQYRQIYSKRQLYEIMVEFWSDHFTIHLLNGLGPTLKPIDDRDVIRQHALGNFRDLLHASAKSPAMLFYLDSYINQLAAPNENYARELMELHTLGVDGGYTENDVKEVARCFTGWSLILPNDRESYGQFDFQEAWHDNGAKSVLGNTISAGGGRTDGEQVIDILASHPSTAKFIATKLCRRFISDNPKSADVAIVAAAFNNSDGDIQDTLRALFALDSFRFTPDQKITRPSEYLAQMVRVLLPQLQYPNDNGLLFYYAQALLGQLPFFWSTPDGYPDVQSYWASTSGMLNRWRLSFLSFAGIIPELEVFTVDYEPLVNNATTITELVDELSASILMRELSQQDRDYLIGRIAEGFEESPDEAFSQVMEAAPLVAAILISSAYFQLR